MAEANPFETTTRRGRRYEDLYGYGGGASMPQSVETGIPIDKPVSPGMAPTSSFSYPGTGINPDGMYSGTNGPSTPSQQTTAAPSYAPTAMAGWDQGKWNDPTRQTPKYQIGRILSQYGATPGGAQQALSEIQKLYPNAQFNGKDILTIPGVGSWDILTGASHGGDSWAWQTLTDANGNPVSQGGEGGGQAGYGGGAYGDEIRAKISQLINQSGNGTDSPVYQNAMAAYNTQSQRDTQAQRNAIAERMAASGQANSGAMDAQLLGAEQAGGEARANFAGQLGQRALEQQRGEIMQALQMGANLMTEEQRLALQERLGMIDANLRQQGMGLQQQQITNAQNQWNSQFGFDTQVQWPAMQNYMAWQMAQNSGT